MGPRTSLIDCCAVILCGGLNSRMGGRNKAFLNVGGKPIIDRIIDILRPFFKEILLVTREPDLYADRPVKIVEDIYRARSSLTGIHAGLIRAEAPYAFVVACDVPFLEPTLVQGLLDEIEPDKDVIVPVFEDHYEPLCAVYAKQCIGVIEAHLDRGDYKIIDFFDEIRLKTVPHETLRAVDPERRSFFNVNTPDAYRQSHEFVNDGEGIGAPETGEGDDGAS